MYLIFHCLTVYLSVMMSHFQILQVVSSRVVVLVLGEKSLLTLLVISGWIRF